MKIIGKILFFNANDGQGIIITAKKEKINFTVADWDDFDTMPSLGLEVRFLYEDSKASSIVSADAVEDETEEENQSGESSEYEAEPEEEKLSGESSEYEAEEEPSPEPEEDEIEGEPSVESEEAEPEEEKEEEPSAESEEAETEEESPLSEQSEKLENENQSEELLEEDIVDEDAEHFDNEEDIAEIGTNEELEEEIGEREESVTVTMNLPMAVSNYFKIIETNIEKRNSYRKVKGRLDYLVIRRFLWTTFNNLCEIDLHIITPKIKALSDDLKAMSNVYDDFARKTKYPKLAYEEVFLSCQAEYKKIRDGAEKTIQRLNQLKGSEKHLGGVLKIKKEELSKDIKTEEFDVMKDELKSLNGAYVDVVHMMAELDERYKHDMKLLIEFEKEYRDEFYDLFGESAKKYRIDIINILSAQAYVLDDYLWQQAKTSKAVKAHFQKAGISGELNTKTYLKYFLDTQDSDKSNADTKKLFELYEYLAAQEREHVMVVLSDVNDALEFESCIKKLDKSYEVKAFIDEKSSLKWAIKNSVKVLILEDELAKMRAETFLAHYKKYILVIPKIILLGNKKHTDDYAISKLLPRGVSAKVIAQNVKELLVDEKDKE